MSDSLKRYLKTRSARVETEMKRLLRLPGTSPIPKGLKASMGYSLMAGGKRLRPILVMAAAECCRLPGAKVLKTACALEMIHTYSLIHDDLPAMDDDDLRRGKLTNHKKFGEALAILAGDGLLTWAFELAAENAGSLGLPGKSASELIRVIAAGAGARGMVAGQAADLEAEGAASRSFSALAVPEAISAEGSKTKNLRRVLDFIHTHKTADLITSSLAAGAILARAGAADLRALRAYGLSIGLAFQIADDILDRTGDKNKLGKKGSDLDNDKLTYPRLYGIEGSRRLAQRHVARAHVRLKRFGPRAAPLHDLADFIITRDR